MSLGLTLVDFAGCLCFSFVNVFWRLVLVLLLKVLGYLLLAVLSVNVAFCLALCILTVLFSYLVVSVGVLIHGGLLVYLCI